MLCICESWLTKLHLDFKFKIQNFDSFRCDRQISRAGGVIMYSKIDVDFIVNRVHIEKSDVFESVTLKVKQKHSHPFYVSVVYISPKNVNKFKLIFMEVFKFVLNKDCIFVGDFNLDFNSSTTNDWFKKVSDIGLKQLIRDPTRITLNTSSIIDHIYVNDIYNVCASGTFDFAISDHFPLFYVRKLRYGLKKKSENNIFRYRDWKRLNVEIVAEEVSNFRFIENCFDINKCCNDLNEFIVKTLHSHLPHKTCNFMVKSSEKWMTNDILQLMKQRDRAKALLKYSCDPFLYNDYSHLRNSVNLLIRNRKSEFI